MVKHQKCSAQATYPGQSLVYAGKLKCLHIHSIIPTLEIVCSRVTLVTLYTRASSLNKASADGHVGINAGKLCPFILFASFKFSGGLLYISKFLINKVPYSTMHHAKYLDIVIYE